MKSEPLPNIAVVTDSTADIPSRLAEPHHVYIVPAILIIEGQSIEDGMGITREEFYRRLPGMEPPPTTSSPSSGAFMAVYERLFQEGFKQIISVHAASLLSGIYNAARIAAQYFGERVRVIDSGQVTLGLGFQALAAAEAIRHGATLEKAIACLEDVRRRVRVIAMLDTLEYVRRSGRVSWGRASIGALLNVKPFIELREGILLRLGETRTRHRGIDRLLSLIQGLGPLERLAILHTNAEEDARRILEIVASQVSTAPLLVNVTTVIGTHVGPNGLGFVAVTK
jgi:DegV family protein with EDD domain